MHAQSGGKVHLQNYRSMPHVFIIFPHPSTQTCYSEMAKFIKGVTNGNEVRTRMEIVNGRGKIEEKVVDLLSYPIEQSKPQVVSLIFADDAARGKNGRNCVGAAQEPAIVFRNVQPEVGNGLLQRAKVIHSISIGSATESDGIPQADDGAGDVVQRPLEFLFMLWYRSRLSLLYSSSKSPLELFLDRLLLAFAFGP
jgi:hypothetical protein